jgi:hypothetical protein
MEEEAKTNHQKLELDIQEKASKKLHAYRLRQNQYHNMTDLAERKQSAQFQSKAAMSYLTHFEFAIQVISNLVRKYFSDHATLLSGVMGRLNHSVTLPYSKRTVTQPLTNADVPAFYYNMKSGYLRATIRDFLDRLLKVIQYENTTNNFEDGILFAERERDEWHQDGLWEAFMNPEVFFSLIPIMGWKKHADRQKYIQRLLTKLDQIDAREITESTTGEIGPLFMEVKEIGRLAREAENLAQFTSARNNGQHNDNTKSNSNGNKYHQKHNNSSKHSVKFHNAKIESNPSSVAYAASTSSTGSTYAAPAPTTATNNTTQNVIKLPAQPSFDHGVSAEQNVHLITSNGRKLQYTATRGMCTRCHPFQNVKNSPGSPHNPNCSTSLCTKCELYGHDQSTCLQTTSGYRSNLPAKKGSYHNKTK